VDQKWVDLAPIFFPTTHVLRDETYNVAYWNLHANTIEKKADGYFVNGRPIAFFHFSGVDLKARQFRPSYQDRTVARPGSPIAELLNMYADLLEENGLSTCSGWDYPFSRFDNGVAYSAVFRDLYASLDLKEKERFGDILQTRRPDSFFEWALTPDPQTGNLSPLLMYLYRLRRDVSAAYPDVLGKDREGFLTWARTSGAREMGYEPAEIRIAGAAAG